MAAETKVKGWSRETRLKVQRLYLGKGLSSAEIASQLAIPKQQVYNIVHRYGLAEIRTRNESRAIARAKDEAVEEAADFVASVTPQAMEEAEGGFHLSRESRAAGDAKGFAMAMKGVQIAVQIARQGLGLDRNSGQGAGGASVSIVFGRFAEVGAPAEKRADPVEVEATEADAGETLDFDESQEGSANDAESAALIGNDAQVTGNAPADTRSLNKAHDNGHYVNHAP